MLMRFQRYIKSRVSNKQLIFLKFVKAKIDALCNSIRVYVSSVFSKHKLLSSFYYFIFSQKFSREERAVLLGRVEYYKSSITPSDSSSLLRRNVHRLEKGLVMQPRREVFAEAYIGATVNAFVDSSRSGKVCGQEIKWAGDVLERFFSVSGRTEIIEAAHKEFSICYENNCKDDLSVPYARNTQTRSEVSYEQLKALFQQRRSVRWYTDQLVDKKLIYEAIDIAKLAPSACNRQSFRFYLATSKEKSVDVAKCAMGTVGFAENINCMVVIVGDLSAYPEERDRHVIYVDGALAGMQLMLALETLGLSSCPINWPDIEGNEKKLSKKLGVNDWERPIMLLSIGHADPNGMIPFSQKKNNEILIKELD